MNIGFDLDKVLIDYPPIIPHTLINKIYKEKDNGMLLYRIPNKPEQYLRLLIHLPFLRQPIKKNLSHVSTLAAKNTHKYFLISSRFHFLKKRTDQLTKKYGLHKIFEKMYFNYENQQPHEFKDAIIKKEHIDRYVDDDLHLLQYVAKHNPQTICYWLNPRQSGKLTDNLFAITTLEEMQS